MERKTYAGHGKPGLFRFGGFLKDPIPEVLVKTYNWDQVKAIYPETTGNTKFWAEAVQGNEPTSGDVTKPLYAKVERLEAELTEASVLAAGFKAREAALLARVTELEEAALFAAPTEAGPTDDARWVTLPAEELDALLEGLEAAGRDAATRMEAIRTNRKASYADRLQCKFLEGTAKTSAWVLQEFEKLDS